MTDKIIKKKALEMFKEGKKHQEIQDTLSEKYPLKPPKSIAEIIKLIPSLETRKKHRIPRLIVLIYFLIGHLFGVVGAIEEGFILSLIITYLVTGSLLYSMYDCVLQAYLIMGVFMLFGLVLLNYLYVLTSGNGSFLLVSVMMTVISGLCFYLYAFMREKYKIAYSKNNEDH